MAFAVVEFKDGVEVVCSSWLRDENKQCLWPACGTDLQVLEQMIKNKEEPGRRWASYRVLRVFCKADTYEKAKERLDRSLHVSDVESSSQSEGERTVKRRKLLKIMPSVSDSGSSDDEENDADLRLISPSTERTSNTPINHLESMNCGDEILSITPKSTQELKLNRKGFELKVLKKLNAILKKDENIINRLAAIETKISEAGIRGNLQEIDEEIAKNLPLRFESNLREFEEQLKDGEFRDKVIKNLSLIGGTDEQNMISKMMKRIMNDDLAERFSWNGAHGKNPFKNLMIPVVILRSIRFHCKDITESKVFACITKWLKYAKQRRMRQELKSGHMEVSKD